MNKKSQVVVVGDVFADMVTHIISYPANGEGTYGTPLERFGGGTGGNVAAGLGRLEVPTTMVCRLGDDETGRFLKSDMAAYGVDTSGMYLDPVTPTGAVVITVDPEGERTIFVFAMNAAYGKLDAQNIKLIEEIQPKAIFLTGVLLGLKPAEETIFAVAEKWKGKSRLYFDPNLRYPTDAVPPEIRSAMQKLSGICDVVLTGESEMNALGLYPQKNQIFIVKCGKAGSKFINENNETVFTIPSTPHIAVDATGAGDTFAAAYIAAELGGSPIREAMQFATSAAGISVTRKGARSMPAREEVFEYFQSIKE
ncbi:MAG: carbohydrate kinase family protein [Clostridiaceae bacterium]